VDGSNPKVQEQYRARVEEWDHEVRHMLRRAGVARLDVPIPTTADPDAVARPILRFFQRHSGRASRS
jgi:hypothetical protein